MKKLFITAAFAIGFFGLASAQSKSITLTEQHLNYMQAKLDTATVLLRNSTLQGNQIEYILSKVNGIILPAAQLYYNRQKFVADSLANAKKPAANGKIN